MDLLARSLKGFAVHNAQLQLLGAPSEFCTQVLRMIATAKNRLVISALYLAEHEEVKLVQHIDTALTTRPDLEATIMLDARRGTRGSSGVLARPSKTFWYHRIIDKFCPQLPNKSKVTSAYSLLAPLKDRHGERLKVQFVLPPAPSSPFLRSLFWPIISGRLGELETVWHVKGIVSDDDVLVTGANLATSYFTDRIDRYLSISNCPELANWMEDLAIAVKPISYTLLEAGQLDVPNTDSASSSNSIHALVNQYPTDVTSDTIIAPLLQVPGFGVSRSSSFISTMVCSSTVDLKISSAYCSFPKSFVASLKTLGCGRLDFLAPSIKSHGFFTAPHLLGLVPYVHDGILRKAVDVLKAKSVNSWHKKDWSFHCKGIWAEERKNRTSAFIIGSSNYGERSTSRDIELDFAVLTSNPKVKLMFKEEYDSLLKDTSRVSQPLTIIQRIIAFITTPFIKSMV